VIKKSWKEDEKELFFSFEVYLDFVPATLYIEIRWEDC
jgi:hypothetical protein